MSFAEQAGVTDPEQIEKYNRMYHGKKNREDVIRSIQNKEESRKKNLIAQEKAEKAEWERITALAAKYSPQPKVSEVPEGAP